MTDTSRKPLVSVSDSALAELANRIEIVPAYDGYRLGAALYRVDDPTRSRLRERKVILVSEESRNLIVAALRAAKNGDTHD